MKTTKKILRFLFGILIGVAIGYGGVMLTLWLTGNLGDSGKSTESGVDIGMLLLSVGLVLVSLVVSVIIHLILHEAGHLIMGLLTGYRFLSFRIFNITLVKTTEGFRFKRFHLAGTGGQCLLDFPEDQNPDEAPWFWYNAGGVLMNLLLIVLSVVLLRCLHPGIVGLSFFMMMIFVGLYLAVVNGIPMCVNGVSNDGYNILTLWRHPEKRRFFVRLLQATGKQSIGVRPQEMPKEWFEDIPLNEDSDLFEMLNRTIYMTLLEDTGRYEEARMVSEELVSMGNRLPMLYHMEVGCERVMLELLTSNRKSVVDQIWTEKLEKYTLANCKFSPMKLAVLHTYALLYDHDIEKANEYKRQLEERQHDFVMPGEVLTAMALMDAGKAKWERMENLKSEIEASSSEKGILNLPI